MVCKSVAAAAEALGYATHMPALRSVARSEQSGPYCVVFVHTMGLTSIVAVVSRNNALKAHYGRIAGCPSTRISVMAESRESVGRSLGVRPGGLSSVSGRFTTPRASAVEINGQLS